MSHDPIVVRREYVREVTKLKLWRVWWLQRHEGMDFETAATNRVQIFRLTVFASDPRYGRGEHPDGWQQVLDELRAAYEPHGADATSEAVEAEGLDLLWPHLEPAIERDVAEDEEWRKGSFGCFKYEYHSFYVEPDSEDHLTLHVRNAYQPDSPFGHFDEMVASLREIVSRAEQERPDVAMAQCATWLNGLPPFAKLFPQSWRDSARPGAPGNHFGWWGQFMDRRGGFHAKNARQFRDTGQFPYTHLLCRCPVGDLRAHLEAALSVVDSC